MSDIEPYSEAANRQLAKVEAKEARGEPIMWSDLVGILEPNPNLPDCQSWRDYDSDLKCALPNHHEGPHRAEVTW